MHGIHTIEQELSPLSGDQAIRPRWLHDVPANAGAFSTLHIIFPFFNISYFFKKEGGGGIENSMARSIIKFREPCQGGAVMVKNPIPFCAHDQQLQSCGSSNVD